MFSPEAASAQQTETLRQQSLEEDEQRSPEHSQHSISIGKLDADGELSLSIGNQELTLSLYQTPDLSEKDAKNICEMFADELAESVNESNYVELPPLRYNPSPEYPHCKLIKTIFLLGSQKKRQRLQMSTWRQ